MKKIINLLFLYFIINSFFFIMILLSLYIFQKDQKDKVADTITSLIRENYILSDFRTLTKDIEKIKKNNFSEIIVVDQAGNIIVKTIKPEDTIKLKIRKSIWLDTSQTIQKGEVVFLYDAFPLLWISLRIIFASLFLTGPGYIIILKYYNKRQKELFENEKIKILAKHTRQLSHDIRSPVATIQHILENDKIILGDSTTIFKKALERIVYITNYHLNIVKTKSDNLLKGNEIKEIINDIIVEKKLEYPNIDFNIDIQKCSVFCMPNEFKSIISNIINNSYESVNNKKPNVSVIGKVNKDKYLLSIQDNGDGIPKEILDKIGKKEISSKEFGNGLGLLSSIELLNSWGASFNIINSDNTGTIITISFLVDRVNYILIDNDELTRLTWESRAIKNGVNLRIYSTFDELKNNIKTLPKNAAIFIDSDLGENETPGELIAKYLFELGFTEISMATGHDKENFKDLKFLKSVINKAPPF